MSITTSELQDMLVYTLKNVSEGKITPAAANAASSVAGKILQTAKLEMDYCKLQGTTSPNMEFFGHLTHTTPYSKKMLDSPKKKLIN